MKEIISKTLNRKQTIPKTFPNIENILKDKNNNLTVFEPKLLIHILSKTDAIPLGQTASLHIMGLKNRMFGLDIFSTQK